MTYPSPFSPWPSTLQVLLLELGSPADFLARAVEPPPPKMLRAALRNLYDLQVRRWYWCIAPYGALEPAAIRRHFGCSVTMSDLWFAAVAHVESFCGGLALSACSTLMTGEAACFASVSLRLQGAWSACLPACLPSRWRLFVSSIRVSRKGSQPWLHRLAAEALERLNKLRPSPRLPSLTHSYPAVLLTYYAF